MSKLWCVWRKSACCRNWIDGGESVVGLAGVYECVQHEAHGDRPGEHEYREPQLRRSAQERRAHSSPPAQRRQCTPL